MDPFSKGFAVGFSIAAPVGPIGLLCIRRSITQGRLAGVCVGLGAATADALYGIVAALGLTAVTATLLTQQFIIQCIGGTFLILLGLTIACPTGSPEAASAPPSGRVGRSKLFTAYASTLVLTLSNPATILSFAGIFAGAGVGTNALGGFAFALFIGGVFSGSMSWWLLLSTSASRLGAKLHPGNMRWINRGAGGFLAGFGFWQLAHLVLK